MAGLPGRLWRPAALVACLACAAVLLSGSFRSDDARRPLRVLQLNLCNSGQASCYTGLAVPNAAAVIRAEAPDVVTLNEICENDVDELRQALADVRRSGRVVGAFRIAPDRPSGGPTRCSNGQPFGIGLLAHVPAPYQGHRIYGGTFPSQDAGDPEVRAWLCLHAAASYYACATHLANANPRVALAQCGYLLGAAVASMRQQGGYEPAVFGGDFNLRRGGTPDVRSCVPAGFLRVDDGSVQQILATRDARIRSSRTISLDETTDHPGLLVTFTVPR